MEFFLTPIGTLLGKWVLELVFSYLLSLYITVSWPNRSKQRYCQLGIENFYFKNFNKCAKTFNIHYGALGTLTHPSFQSHLSKLAKKFYGFEYQEVLMVI